VRFYPLSQLFNDWLLEDDFSVEVLGRWQFVDEGDQESPSSWTFAAGELQQNSKIWGGSLDGSVPDKPGTQALAGDPAWSDYRLSVGWISDDEDAIGVLFRYQDEDNYYRFSIDRSRNYHRLIKKFGGTVSVLWEASAGYDLGRPYLATVDCIGNQLRVYLDGVLIAEVKDGDLATGKIGLYCWGNTGARFTEVRVSEPTWRPYYTFQNEDRLPAGTRLRVYAGNLQTAPLEEPNVQRRFIANLDESGQTSFPGTGVDLRIVDSTNQAFHARRFLPESLYADISDIRVLRKSDGTGFFLLIPSATSSLLPKAQYRLRITYRRNNSAVDPSSLVYQEAGNSEDEQVLLDIPWETVNE